MRLLALLSWVLFLSAICRAESAVDVPASKNHYIVVLDSSGSMLQKIHQTEIAIQNLVERLSHSGFGSEIPAFQSGHDWLTIYHLGIAPGNSSAAWQYLRNRNIHQEFLHEVMRHESALPRDLGSVLRIRQPFGIAGLSIAKELALEHSRPDRRSERIAHTYLILLSDRELNAGSLADERTMFMRLMGASERKDLSRVLEEVNNGYEFRRSKEPAIETAGLVDLDAYEVVPKSRKSWEDDLLQGPAGKSTIDSLLTPFWNWKGSDKAFAGMRLAPEAIARLRSSGVEGATLEVHAGKQSVVNEQFDLAPTVASMASFANPGCEVTELSTVLRIPEPAKLADDLVGTRDASIVVRKTGPMPSTVGCLVQSKAVVLVTVGILGLLSLIAGLAWFWLAPIRVQVRLPGAERRYDIPLSGPPPVASIGCFLPPQAFMEAFIVVVTPLHRPPRMLRWLAALARARRYKNAGMMWNCEQTGFRLNHRALMLGKGGWENFPVSWAEVGTGSAQVAVSMGSGASSNAVVISYPQARQRADDPDDFEYHVALDLGSESTAAYCEQRDLARGVMIDLLVLSRTLLGRDKKARQRIEHANRELSTRIRTLVTIENDLQPEVLPLEHAWLDITDQRSATKPLFTFFHADGSSLHNLLPNPKIPFQFGTRDILPRVKAAGSGKLVKHTPDVLMQHLAALIVNNLVLGSPTLRGAPRNRIHLTLTVPNVYSLTHADAVCSFVEKAVRPPLGKVDFLYESDALAYIALGATAEDDADLQKFNASLTFTPGPTKRLVTIDVGRGTNDLSLIEFGTRVSSRAQKGQHQVLARTGNCEGGNRLSWIFVEYYEERLIQEFGSKLNFTFTQAPSQYELAPVEMNMALQKLIEEVKKSISVDYRLELEESRQSDLLRDVFNMLQKETPADLGNNGFVMRMTIPTGELPRSIKGKIEAYVERNVELLNHLAQMAALRDGEDGSVSNGRGRAFNAVPTFALIGGQASQFAPLKEALRATLKRLGFPEDRICFLKGSNAKEACCRGAVRARKAGFSFLNPDEIFGTYAFMKTVALSPADQFRPVDMYRLKAGQPTDVNVSDGPHWFVFSPFVRFSELPRLYDGTTAMLKEMRPVNGRFRVQYDAAARKVSVNGYDVALSSYGGVYGPIYEKVWPERCRVIRDDD